jgi:hypothetical protein
MESRQWTNPRSVTFVTVTILMSVVVEVVLLNPWSSWNLLQQFSDPLLSEWPFLRVLTRFFFLVCFKEVNSLKCETRKTGEIWSFKWILTNTSFFLNRYVINDCKVFSGHIGNGVRWTPVNTGNWWSPVCFAGLGKDFGSGKEYCWSEN